MKRDDRQVRNWVLQTYRRVKVQYEAVTEAQKGFSLSGLESMTQLYEDIKTKIIGEVFHIPFEALDVAVMLGRLEQMTLEQAVHTKNVITLIQFGDLHD